MNREEELTNKALDALELALTTCTDTISQVYVKQNAAIASDDWDEVDRCKDLVNRFWRRLGKFEWRLREGMARRPE